MYLFVVAFFWMCSSTTSSLAAADDNWKANQSPQAITMARLELNYPVEQVLELARSEDVGSERVRVSRLLDRVNEKKPRQPETSRAKEIAHFVRQQVARGKSGIILGQGRKQHKGRDFWVFRYQIQGSSEPLIISAYGFEDSKGFLLVTYLTSPFYFKLYRDKVDNQVLKIADNQK